MKRTNRFSSMRIIYAIIMALVFLIGSAVMAVLSSMLLDEIICLLLINICYYLLFLFSIVRKRLRNEMPEFNYITYGKITFAVILSFLIAIISILFAPDFFAPVMIIPIIAMTVMDAGLGLALGVYFVSMMAITQNYSIYLIICYILMVCFGSFFSEFLKAKDTLERFYTLILIFSVNTLLSVIFYYFNFLEISLLSFLYGLIDGIIVCIVAGLLVPLLNKLVYSAQTVVYDELLDSEYSLQKDIRKFSFIEYQHAHRVCRLCRLCAKEISANEDLAAAGGFYYRLGKLEGEPMIDNAIKIANNHCFPEELIDILAEYGGVLALPSSKESAIVHMVDTVVTKVELFDADSMTSSWNQNMVIYQTINELSQKGFYDNSGLTMNQFLLIRECLAKEDILA